MGDVAKITAQQIQNPGIAAEYDRINGEYTALKTQYDKLLTQREQVRLRGVVRTETDALNIELLDPPSTPNHPSAPNRPPLLNTLLPTALRPGGGATIALLQGSLSSPTPPSLPRASRPSLPV